MSNLFNMPRVEAQDSSGNVLAGAKLEFFITATATNLDTYSDDALTTANANPVVADSAGRWGAIFLRDADYKVVLSDSDDVQIWSADPVKGGVDNLIDDTLASTLSTAGSANAYTLTVNRVITAYANGDVVICKSNFENTGAPTINITGGQTGASALGAKTIKKQAAGTQVDLIAGDIQSSQWLFLKYDGTNFQLLSPVANAQNWAKGGDIASATTIVIDTDGCYFDITGSTGPIGTMTVSAGREFTLQFDSTPTLTDSATLDLGGADIIAIAGDRMKFFPTADNTVNLVSRWREGQGAGSIVQVVNTQDGTLATGTTVIPLDDTIPQNTEGDEYITQAITPKSTANRLVIQVNLMISNSVANRLIGALFQDTTANALAVHGAFQSTAAAITSVSFVHEMAAGTTSATTFKVRAGGPSAGTTTLNGESGARLFGGVATSSITIWEITA